MCCHIGFIITFALIHIVDVHANTYQISKKNKKFISVVRFSDLLFSLGQHASVNIMTKKIFIFIVEIKNLTSY